MLLAFARRAGQLRSSGKEGTILRQNIVQM